MNKLTNSIMLCTFLLLAAVVCYAWQTKDKTEGDGERDIRDSISTLKRDVNELAATQRTILDQLNKLKQAIAESSAVQHPTQPNQPLSELDIGRADLFRGNPGADIAIIEYGDFECAYCAEYEREVYPKLFRAYIKPGKVKYFYRDFPLPGHAHAMMAARAARCAGEQGKYWEMHDSLFAKQADLTIQAITERASVLGMDAPSFGQCLSSDRYTDDLRSNASEAEKLGINATPTFFIGVIAPNGNEIIIRKRVVGAQAFDVFRATLDLLIGIRASLLAK